jgi:hypothetical protein
MNSLATEFYPPVTYKELFKEEFLTLYLNKTDNWIYADWTGFQTTETIKNGSEHLLQAVLDSGVHKLINDNTHLTGMRANAVEWLALNLAPRLQTAGLQYISWIYKTNSLSEASADLVLSISQTDIIVIVFDHVTMAEKWLRSVV